MTKKGDKPQEVSLDAHNFLMIKHVKDEDDKVLLVGTMIQHVFSRDVEDKEPIEFPYRLNDEQMDADTGYVKKRETKIIQTGRGTLYRHTYQVKVPLELEVTIDWFPFRVVSAQLLIELSTFTDESTNTKVRPSLIVHKFDKSNMLTIQANALKEHDPNKSPTEEAKEKMDRTELYDFVCPFPRVRYLYEKKNLGCPKYFIDFLMVEDGMKKFVEVVFPMVLVAAMNTVHVRNTDDPDEQSVTDYLANSATFALTVVFFLPTMIGSSRRQQFLTLNNLYIILIFISLLLSSLPQQWVGSKAPSEVGMWLYWISFILPIYNYFRYSKYIRENKDRIHSEFFMKKNTEKKKSIDYEEHFLSIRDLVVSDRQALEEMEYNITAETKKYKIVEYGIELANNVGESGKRPNLPIGVSDVRTG